MVAREGSAPPTSGCRPDAILFHHRADVGCRGWNCTSIRAFKGRCPTIRRPGNWWPARVTLLVPRIKSPLHHFNACRPKWCSRQDSHPHWRRSRRRWWPRANACWLDYASDGNGASSRCRPGAISLQKKFTGCCMEAKWSQSPVLPWAQRAYETCVSAGSTALNADGCQTGARTRNCTGLSSLTERAHR